VRENGEEEEKKKFNREIQKASLVSLSKNYSQKKKVTFQAEIMQAKPKMCDATRHMQEAAASSLK
jgi:hypothetical protein